MTDPLDSNDDWADLAREFKLDKPASPEPEPHAAHAADMVERTLEAEAVEPHHGTDARVEDAAVAEGETEAETAEDDFDDAEEAETPAGEAGAEGEQPGTGRKRRRRRRRRRKGGGTPAEGAAPVEGSEAESAPETEGEEEPTAEPVAEAEEFGEAEEGEPVPLAAEEDTASEVLRELIATWNVPSWDEIVGGLYRPN